MFSLTNRTFRNSLRDDGSTATSLNISIYHESTIFQNFPIYLFQVKGDVYLYYFRSVGGWLSFFTLLLYVAYQVSLSVNHCSNTLDMVKNSINSGILHVRQYLVIEMVCHQCHNIFRKRSLLGCVWCSRSWTR